MMNKYKMIIHWSEEDQLFIAEVPELHGCMADGHRIIKFSALKNHL
jgi:predicted RNase H-like HicB family nuclease